MVPVGDAPERAHRRTPRDEFDARAISALRARAQVGVRMTRRRKECSVVGRHGGNSLSCVPMSCVISSGMSGSSAWTARSARSRPAPFATPCGVTSSGAARCASPIRQPGPPSTPRSASSTSRGSWSSRP